MSRSGRGQGGPATAQRGGAGCANVHERPPLHRSPTQRPQRPTLLPLLLPVPLHPREQLRRLLLEHLRDTRAIPSRPRSPPRVPPPSLARTARRRSSSDGSRACSKGRGGEETLLTPAPLTPPPLPSPSPARPCPPPTPPTPPCAASAGRRPPRAWCLAAEGERVRGPPALLRSESLPHEPLARPLDSLPPAGQVGRPLVDACGEGVAAVDGADRA